MAHRDVSISLIGVAAGLIIGAGTFAGSQDASLGADLLALAPENLRPAAFDILTRRLIENSNIPYRRGTDITSYPTVVTPSSSSSSSAPVLELTPCIAVQKTVAQLQASYNAVTPMNVSNTASRTKMQAAFADALGAYCTQTANVSSSSAAAVTETPLTIQNGCDKYPLRSIRYSQCVINTGLGKTYP